MNQGRIWCVVHPTVGLPLFLGSVALTSLAVHTAVMTHTNWMSSYWQGRDRTKVSENATPSVAVANAAQSPFSVVVTPVPSTSPNAPASVVITVAPNAAAAATETKSAEAPAESSAAVALR